MQRISLFLLIGILTAACGSGGNSTAGDRDEEIKLTQYMVQGKMLYTTYCINCHGEGGEGLAKLFPPLKNSDYLLSDLPRAACMIKNGKVGEIMVNGTSFNQMMPANESLTPIEIAEILTYVTNSWGNEKGLSSAKEVGLWLERCSKP